jgi:hypothetical protein
MRKLAAIAAVPLTACSPLRDTGHRTMRTAAIRQVESTTE